MGGAAMTKIPPPTARDYEWDIEGTYSLNEIALNTADIDSATATDARIQNMLIRLLAAERKQNAERGEIIKALLGRVRIMETDVSDDPHVIKLVYECPWCPDVQEFDSLESLVHQPECVAERARRAGVAL
jgi:ethanolamine ammonia-lyase small subunit